MVNKPLKRKKGHHMDHKGVEYSIARSAVPGFWNWRFSIGDRIITGKTKTKLAGMAAHRVRVKIDLALTEVAASLSGACHRPIDLPDKAS